MCCTGIYALLDNGTTFERPAHLLQAVGLYDLTQASSWVGGWGACGEPRRAAASRHGALAGLDAPTACPHYAHPPTHPWQASLFEHLRETYGESSDLVGAELVAGVGRANYGGQTNLQLNALAGAGGG